MVNTILRFENTAKTTTVTRHATTCPLAKPSPTHRYEIVADDEDNIDDLFERGFKIVTCKCAKSKP